MAETHTDDAQLDPQTRRRAVLRLLILALAAAALLALAFGLGNLVGEGPPPQEITPHDTMRTWANASTGVKQTAVDALLIQLEREGVLGPQTRARLHGQGGRARLGAELLVEIDQAANPNVKAYVSPGESILNAAKIAVGRLKWNE
jgi:hypothetical protein